MNRARRWAKASVLGVLGAAACATSTGSGGQCGPGTYDLKGTGSCDYKCTPGPAAPSDPIDAAFVDENCDGSDGVVAKCIFVATDGADSANAGTRDAPMKTLAYAIKAAKDRGGMDVCASGETYTGEVDMISGVSLYGGFNEHADGFAFRREKGVVTTLTAKGTVVVAAGIDVDTHLEGLLINAAAPDPPITGLGVYGVRLIGGLGTLFVRDDNINTEPGQDGEAGKPGAAGANGVNGIDGQAGCNGCKQSIAPNPPGGSLGGASAASMCGGAAGGKGGQGGYDQAPGDQGGNGSGSNSSGGAGGSGGSTCTVSGGGNGADGQSPNQPAANGTDGAGGVAKGAFENEASFTPARGGEGQIGVAGNAGGGGGGGGGGTNGGLCNGDRGSGGGSGATGGCAGSPGTGAQGGGASFAISARAGRLVAGGNRLQAGKGGNGGAGGSGGAGGAGGKGGSGSGRNDDGGSSGKGGDGSKGGGGGNGGGGAGGPSACIATAAGVVLDETPVNQCTAFGGGSGGAGGNNAADNGADGLTAPHLTF